MIRSLRVILAAFLAGLMLVLGVAPANADTRAPSTPTGLQASSPRTGTVVLTWSRSTDNVRVTRYGIIRNGRQVATTTGTSWTDTGQIPGSRPSYRVRAYDAAGNRSSQSTFVRPNVAGQNQNNQGQSTKPSTPSNLRGSSANGAITLTWGASTAAGGIASYTVIRSGKTVGTVNGTSFTDRSVVPGTDYWYRVVANGNRGTSSNRTSFVKVRAVGGVAPPGNNGGWRLVWSDEFNGTQLDTSKWNIETSNFGATNGTLHCYTRNNVEVSGGQLRLTAKRETRSCSGTTMPYTSGMVHTKNKVDWTYGRFEVRARLVPGTGMFPAVWLQPANLRWGAWPRSGEIDIVEQIGQRPTIMAGSIHWGNTNDPQRKVTEYFSPTRLTDAFHTYAIEWEPGVVRWYIDGQLFATSRPSDGWFVPGGGGGFGAPFNQDFFLMINLAVGGDWPGAPNANTPLPNPFRIDYVRVYQR